MDRQGDSKSIAVVVYFEKITKDLFFGDEVLSFEITIFYLDYIESYNC